MMLTRRRVARLESVEQIRQLASRYAFSADSRDLQSLVDLYADRDEPVYFPSDTGGIHKHDLLKWVENSLGQYGVTQHFVCNHIIEIDDANHAHGLVYCYM